MKKTFLEIKEADSLVAQMYQENPLLKDGKFSYAWKKFIDKNFKPTAKELNELVEDKKLELCLVDKTTKEILYGESHDYKFDREGLQALYSFIRLMNQEYENKEIEVIPYFIKTEYLPVFTEEQKEVLTGLIIE